MANDKSHAEHCAELEAWLLEHDGLLPNRRSGDKAEASLADWFAKASQRRSRALGSNPSLQQLTPKEVEQLEDGNLLKSLLRIDIVPAQRHVVPCRGVAFAWRASRAVVVTYLALMCRGVPHQYAAAPVRTAERSPRPPGL